MLPDRGNVVCHVVDLFLACKFDLSTDWCVNEYTFLMTTLIKKAGYMRRASIHFPDS